MKQKPQRKKSIGFVLLFLLSLTGFGSQWTSISSSTPVDARINLVSSNIDHPRVHFSLAGFNLQETLTTKGIAYTVAVKKGSQMEIEGAPDLPKLTTSLIIPDDAEMEVAVVSTSYKDFYDIDIAPSKGIISRAIDPSTIPYQYGDPYSKNDFYPGNLTGLRDPFILRDFRGQTLIVYPFQYNPVAKVLRVYYDMVVELRKVSQQGTFNKMIRNVPRCQVDREFHSIYANQFLNYKSLSDTILNEYGNILVISYGAFMPAMQTYVNWKRSIGFPTKMISIDSVGTTPAQIKQYIADYYNTYGLTFVLLVGDNQQIPTYQGTGAGGPSDNYYGYIVGNDHYADAFIGRFSAENIDQVKTQVQRTIDYERNPQFITGNWLPTMIGIASALGPGDDGEYDYQHIRHQESELLNYTYTSGVELFDGTEGGNDAPGNPGPNDVANAVNNGASIILYCGHGSMTSWGTSGFANTNVNALTNQGKLPFIWSVACVNGEFMNGTCFAESWLRATNNGQPTGAIAFLGSTIDQSWDSPMAGQDFMTDILTESYQDNIKRTYGGISINGCMEMITEYGADGENMADTWTIFGDPSVMVRTRNPLTLDVVNLSKLPLGTTSLQVSCNTNGARATLMQHGNILNTQLVNNNMVSFSFPAMNTPGDTLLLTVTSFNSIPYQSNIVILPKVKALFTATPLEVHTGESVKFSDFSTGNPVSWYWSFPGGTPSSSEEQNPVVKYYNKGTFDVQLVVSNGITFDTLYKTAYIGINYSSGVENNSVFAMSVAPNPNNGIFKVDIQSFQGDDITITVIDPLGHIVYEEQDFSVNDKTDTTIDLSGMREGIYFLNLKNSNQTIFRKIVIRK
jgi:PKD repeat protein